MAIFTKVDVRVWDDKYFHSLSPEAKLLFLYLAFHALLDEDGRLDAKNIPRDTGINLPTANRLMDDKFLTEASAWSRGER